MGISVGSETARAMAKLAADRQEWVEARKTWWISSVSLAVTLRLDPAVLLNPAESEITPHRFISDAVVQMSTHYVLHRPDIQSSQLDQAILDHKLSAAKWDLYTPDILLEVNENQVGKGFDRIGDQAEAGVFLQWRFSMEKFRQMQWVQAQQEEAQIRNQQMEEKAIGEVNMAIQEMHSFSEQIPFAKEQLEAAEKSLRISQSRYRAGTAIALEVLDAEDRLAQARLNLAKSILSFNLSQIRLLTVSGLMTEKVFED